MAVITISRHPGSLGDTIARALAERLQYRLVERSELVQLAARIGGPDVAWDLEQMVKTIAELSVAFGVPFISGKDSSSGTFETTTHDGRSARRIDVPPTEFLGYERIADDATVLAIVRGVDSVPFASEGDEVDVRLRRDQQRVIKWHMRRTSPALLIMASAGKIGQNPPH